MKLVYWLRGLISVGTALRISVGTALHISVGTALHLSKLLSEMF